MSSATLVVTACSVAAFVLAFTRSGLVATVRDALATLGRAQAAMSDAGLDDLAREKAVQAAGLRLLGLAGGIALRGGLVLAAALLPVVAAHSLGFVRAGDTLSVMARLDVIAVATLAVIAGHLAWRRIRSR
mgnify:CR=1 FL=1